MSSTPATDVGSPDIAGDTGAVTRAATPRVRHQAREAVVLMAFSAGTSTAFAACFLLLTGLGRQG